jgi:hypothetical protein
MKHSALSKFNPICAGHFFLQVEAPRFFVEVQNVEIVIERLENVEALSNLT